MYGIATNLPNKKSTIHIGKYIKWFKVTQLQNPKPMTDPWVYLPTTWMVSFYGKCKYIKISILWTLWDQEQWATNTLDSIARKRNAIFEINHSMLPVGVSNLKYNSSNSRTGNRHDHKILGHKFQWHTSNYDHLRYQNISKPMPHMPYMFLQRSSHQLPNKQNPGHHPVSSKQHRPSIWKRVADKLAALQTRSLAGSTF